MAKAPRAGRVKTRLAADIGHVEAVWWYRHQCIRLLRSLRDARWTLVLAVSPDVDPLNECFWPSDLRCIPQGQGDLGSRMARLIRQFPQGPVLIVGSDIPGIDRREIAHALELLRQKDAVIGPCEDGGFWSIGIRRSQRLPKAAMKGVRWSTMHAMDDTLSTMRSLRVARARTMSDVDTLDDLVTAQST